MIARPSLYWSPKKRLYWKSCFRSLLVMLLPSSGVPSATAALHLPIFDAGAIAARYGALSTVSWRIYNQVDVVPYFPMDVSNSYQPVTTGYAINPARDFGPRMAHAVLPIAGKAHSDWAYAWVPIAGPLIGGSLAGYVLRLIGA